MLRRKTKQGQGEEDQAGPLCGLWRFSPHTLIGHLLCARHCSKTWDTAKNKNKTDLDGVLEDLLCKQGTNQGVNG